MLWVAFIDRGAARGMAVSMSLVQSLPPLIDGRATRLILGTMPGRASLAAGEYYAHGRNAFWSIIEATFGIPRHAPYPERTAALMAEGVAVWDVLHTCRRRSSLDSDIEPGSVVPNDVALLLREHPSLSRVYFNGAKAEALYLKLVLPGLASGGGSIARFRLPSTSPAHAGMNLAAKISAWSVIQVSEAADPDAGAILVARRHEPRPEPAFSGLGSALPKRR